MGRIRTVKPELFKHEELFDLEKETGLPIRTAFMGLFTCCDKEGRFKWRPRALKLDVLPYDDVDFSRVLDALMTRGFVVKYVVEDEFFGFIPTFSKHQVINNRESDSELPEPEESLYLRRESAPSHYETQPDGSSLSTTQGWVYVALCKTSRAFKVGFAEKNPEQRVRDLSTGSPHGLEFVEAIESNRAGETKLHRALAAYKLRGEWFRICDASCSVLDASFTRAGRVTHAASGEGKGKEGKGREGEQEGKETLVEQPQLDPVKTIFEFWQKVMDSPKSVLDDKRKRLIAKTLKSYSPADICRAIRGCSKTPHNMGVNDSKTKYNGLGLILRDADHIDRFIRNDAGQARASSGAETIEQTNARVMAELTGGVLDDGNTIEMEAP